MTLSFAPSLDTTILAALFVDFFIVAAAIVLGQFVMTRIILMFTSKPKSEVKK